MCCNRERSRQKIKLSYLLPKRADPILIFTTFIKFITSFSVIMWSGCPNPHVEPRQVTQLSPCGKSWQSKSLYQGTKATPLDPGIEGESGWLRRGGGACVGWIQDPFNSIRSEINFSPWSSVVTKSACMPPLLLSPSTTNPSLESPPKIPVMQTRYWLATRYLFINLHVAFSSLANDKWRTKLLRQTLMGHTHLKSKDHKQ